MNKLTPIFLGPLCFLPSIVRTVHLLQLLTSCQLTNFNPQKGPSHNCLSLGMFCEAPYQKFLQIQVYNVYCVTVNFMLIRFFREFQEVCETGFLCQPALFLSGLIMLSLISFY